ncbi:MAG TPA: 50S ribosomal protein L4 [Candidatus Limnocylindria bacterium]|nr:50S ribosomal protein L4 [Candidatus Limnocylindria bacterium]
MATQKTTLKTRKKASAPSSDMLRVLAPEDLGLAAEQKKAHSDVGFAIWVRTLLQNWRQGTVSCKGRSDVARSNKKPWKQKGTGRARAGSARSPVWRGGGVSFGPQPRTRTLTLSSSAKKGVLNTLLFNALEHGKVGLLKWNLEGDAPKTTAAFSALKNVGLHTSKVVLFIPVNDTLTYASFANIPNVRILSFDQANAYDLADSQQWIVLDKDFGQFKEMTAQWI